MRWNEGTNFDDYQSKTRHRSKTTCWLMAQISTVEQSMRITAWACHHSVTTKVSATSPEISNKVIYRELIQLMSSNIASLMFLKNENISARPLGQFVAWQNSFEVWRFHFPSNQLFDVLIRHSCSIIDRLILKRLKAWNRFHWKFMNVARNRKSYFR